MPLDPAVTALRLAVAAALRTMGASDEEAVEVYDRLRGAAVPEDTLDQLTILRRGLEQLRAERAGYGS